MKLSEIAMDGKYYRIVMDYEHERFLVFDKELKSLETYIIFDSFFPDTEKIWMPLISLDENKLNSKKFKEFLNFYDRLEKEAMNGWKDIEVVE